MNALSHYLSSSSVVEHSCRKEQSPCELSRAASVNSASAQAASAGNALFLRAQYDALRRLRVYWLPRWLLHWETRVTNTSLPGILGLLGLPAPELSTPGQLSGKSDPLDGTLASSTSRLAITAVSLNEPTANLQIGLSGSSSGQQISTHTYTMPSSQTTKQTSRMAALEGTSIPTGRSTGAKISERKCSFQSSDRFYLPTSYASVTTNTSTKVAGDIADTNTKQTAFSLVRESQQVEAFKTPFLHVFPRLHPPLSDLFGSDTNLNAEIFRSQPDVAPLLYPVLPECCRKESNADSGFSKNSQALTWHPQHINLAWSLPCRPDFLFLVGLRRSNLSWSQMKKTGLQASERLMPLAGSINSTLVDLASQTAQKWKTIDLQVNTSCTSEVSDKTQLFGQTAEHLHRLPQYLEESEEIDLKLVKENELVQKVRATILADASCGGPFKAYLGV
ncbi:unnamed protein product [Protopolystoma xenopodis]|uniref:Uncharacterized protein n=1 Tax=Protopolystoma xenopodis TaxID=117903 RepID=A0A448WCK5_9PLAT|nr:unnamed protein product [Protopolystoma xenopodis]